MIFQTARLTVRKATPANDDVELFYRLWTDPRVMTAVGFPQGLRITREQIRDGIVQEGDTEYDRKLPVVLTGTGELIGECKLGRPDDDGISETDVKLLPEYWGSGFGAELKRGLVDYLFQHTDCRAVKATPNRTNIASRKMQEAVGARRVGQGVYRFPEKMRPYTIDVPYDLYMVFRKDWAGRDARSA